MNLWCHKAGSCKDIFSPRLKHGLQLKQPPTTLRAGCREVTFLSSSGPGTVAHTGSTSIQVLGVSLLLLLESQGPCCKVAGGEILGLLSCSLPFRITIAWAWAHGPGPRVCPPTACDAGEVNDSKKAGLMMWATANRGREPQSCWVATHLTGVPQTHPRCGVYVTDIHLQLLTPCPLEHTQDDPQFVQKSMKKPPLLLSSERAPLSLAWIADNRPGLCCPGIARRHGYSLVVYHH